MFQRADLTTSIKSCDKQIASLNEDIQKETEEFNEMKNEKTEQLEELLVGYKMNLLFD